MLLDEYDGFIFDLDGTIYRGDELLSGARRVIEEIKKADDKNHIFLSNKPIARRENYARKLTELGIETDVEEVINSSYVTAHYLQKRAGDDIIYVIGERALQEELVEAGLNVAADTRQEELREEGNKIVSAAFSDGESRSDYDFLSFSPPGLDYEDVDWLVVSFDRTFHYGKLNDALQILNSGANFIATNPDNTCPVAGGEVPDAASMIAAVEAASGEKVDKIMGKPSQQMITTALEAMGFDPDQKGQKGQKDRSFLMIGDRLETDIRMGEEAGIGSAAVLTGVSTRADISASNVEPDHILKSVEDLLK